MAGDACACACTCACSQRACPCPGRPETARISFSTARLVQVSPEVGLPAGGEASATEEA